MITLFHSFEILCFGCLQNLKQVKYHCCHNVAELVLKCTSIVP